MFKPSVHSPTLVDGETFPSTGDVPCTVSYMIAASPEWKATRTVGEQNAVAEQIVAGYQANLAQFVSAARQERDCFGQKWQRKIATWPKLTAELTFNYGVETLRVVITPSAGSDTSTVSVQNIKKISVPYTGFPVPSMGTYGDVLLKAFAPNGTFYPFDFYASPSAPGTTSHFDSTSQAYKSTSPVSTPIADIEISMNSFAPPQYVPYTTYNQATRTYSQDSSRFDITTDPAQWCPGVAGNAILTTPLSGKQVWEIEITELPGSKVPTGAVLEDAFYGQSAVPIKSPLALSHSLVPWAFLSGFASPYQTKFPTDVSTWGTPSIGVCPAYYLPDDLQNFSPTDIPQLYMDYGSPLGCDVQIKPTDPVGKKARSIYTIVTSFIAKQTTGVGWMCGIYDCGPIDPGFYGVTGYAIDAQQLKADMIAWSATDQSTVPPSVYSPGSGYILVAGEPEFLVANPLRPALIADVTVTYSVGSMGVASGGNVFRLLPPLNQADMAPVNHACSQSDFLSFIAAHPSSYISLGVGQPDAVDPSVFEPWAASAHGYFSGARAGSVPNVSIQALDYYYLSSSTFGGPLDTVVTETNTSEYVLHGTPVNTSYPGYQGYACGVSSPGASGNDIFPDRVVNSSSGTTIYEVGNVRYTSPYTIPVKDNILYGDFVNFYVGSDALTFDWAYWDLVLDTTVTISPAIAQMFSNGTHSPVFIGRVDQWTFYDNSSNYYGGLGGGPVSQGVSDGSDVKIDGSRRASGQVMGMVGQFTGVDLGTLAVGDVIMIATDTSTGYVWFGKNGTWYGPGDSHGVTVALNPSTDGPAHGTKWAAVMDGGSASAQPVTTPSGPYDYATGRPRYFPAVGYRIGPLKANLLYGDKVKHTPPSGFTAYGNNASMTISR